MALSDWSSERLEQLRHWILYVLVFGLLGTEAELVLLEHYCEFWQLVPLFLITVAIASVVWHAMRDSLLMAWAVWWGLEIGYTILHLGQRGFAADQPAHSQSGRPHPDSRPGYIRLAAATEARCTGGGLCPSTGPAASSQKHYALAPAAGSARRSRWSSCW